MPAHFEIRQGSIGAVGAERFDDTAETEPTHEWVALVGGNGEVMFTTETYPIGHGNAMRAVRQIVAAIDEAAQQPIRTANGATVWP